jgi:hypothetical protein
VIFRRSGMDIPGLRVYIPGLRVMFRRSGIHIPGLRVYIPGLRVMFRCSGMDIPGLRVHIPGLRATFRGSGVDVLRRLAPRGLDGLNNAMRQAVGFDDRFGSLRHHQRCVCGQAAIVLPGQTRHL